MLAGDDSQSPKAAWKAIKGPVKLFESTTSCELE
jgi:hypothetical protein